MIINGRKLAEEKLADLKKQFKKFNKVVLAAVLVGDNSASLSFLKKKADFAKSLGVDLRIFRLPAAVSQARLIEEIKKIGRDKKIAGIIIQLPLPKKFDSTEILKYLPAKKDVDALSPNALVLPPAAGVAKFIFQKYKIKLADKKIVIVGMGRLVGRPITAWLKSEGLAKNLSIIEKKTSAKKRADLVKAADIIISGVGKADLILAKQVKKEAIVVDFGYSFKNGKISGDVNKKAAIKAGLFTPTPGGTGPLLVAMLFQNLVELLKAEKNGRYISS